MSLFDSKQEVINIELTSHGKKLLAQGKLSPKYYAFFDDDVIYDYSYAALTESANGEADVRIRKQTPYLKTNYSVLGQEVKLNKGDVSNDVISKITDYETKTLLKYPLGNSKIGEVTGSYVDLLLLEGGISNVYTTASAFSFNEKTAFNKQQTKVQIEALEFRPEIRSLPEPTMTSPPELLDPERTEPAIVSPVLEDKTYIYVEVDRLLLSLNELNSIEDYKNFEINVYKIETNDEGEEEYNKLRFSRPPQSLIDSEGFLLEANELPDNEEEIDNNSVEFYFNIRIDEEIDTELLTSRVPRDELGRPIINDPLIRDEVTIRQRANFLRDGDNNGEPC
jgi:hypothetical protein